jgi:hypothetical protein
MSERKEIDILKLAEDFLEMRDKIFSELGYVDEHDLPDQIKRIANSLKKYDYADKQKLSIFLSALCVCSSKRPNLLLYRIGRRAGKKLAKLGLRTNADLRQFELKGK